MDRVLVRLEGVSKRYKDKYIIKNLSLDIYEGEFLTLLGASGCGKTTILRMISGLENVTSGKIYIDGEDVTELDPTKRKVNTIFQNLALFPHMTVAENIAFGLKMKKIDKEEIKIRVKKIIKLVKLEGFEERYPLELSGGQQQRVAIARGIVTNPKVLLLDESLCSLDLKLKRQMQVELLKIQRQLGITFIYVTHDQDEALTMSDRVVIINKGVIEQNDTPQNIYMKPSSVFVADFIGESNIFKGLVEKVGEGNYQIKVADDFSFVIKNSSCENLKKVTLIIRPENIKVYDDMVEGTFQGIIKGVIYGGDVTKLVVKVSEKCNFKVNIYNGFVKYSKNDLVYLKVSDDGVVCLGEKNEKK